MTYQKIVGVFWVLVTTQSVAIQAYGLSLKNLAHKRYNEVAFATAHNGQSFMPSPVRNQDCPITVQLQAGIRAIKIPLWYGIDAQGKRVLYACHGVSKTILQEAYLGSFINKVPWLFRSYAQKIFNSIQPIDQLVVDALNVAYGASDAQSGVIPFNHAILDPAACPLEKVFKEVGSFLAKNPDEIVTLILEDFTNNRAAIAMAVHLAGIYSYVHTQPISQPWPTIGQMVKANARLVLLVRTNDVSSADNYPWLHDLWSFAWDTRWDFKKIADFKHDCVPNRGAQAYEARGKEPYNKLFIVYHFITPMTGGSKHWAIRANRVSILESRLKSLQKLTGHIPNFVQVDFFQYPHNDIFTVINHFNNVQG